MTCARRRLRCRRELGRELRRRPDLCRAASCTRCEALELRGLDVVADQLAEVLHRSSSSSSSASRRSAERVRVLTVPSGMLTYVGDLALREPAPVRELDERALLLGERLERPVHAPRDPARPRPRRPGPGPARRPRAGRPPSAAACGGGRRRSRSGRPCRATTRPRRAPGRTARAERQTLANVSCVTSSARSRSPIRRSAIPSTERA